MSFKAMNITRNKMLGLFETQQQAFYAIKEYCKSGYVTWDGEYYLHESGDRFSIEEIPLFSKEQIGTITQKSNR